MKEQLPKGFKELATGELMMLGSVMLGNIDKPDLAQNVAVVGALVALDGLRRLFK